MKPRTFAYLYGLLALIGLADAAYLTWDHYQHLTDPEFAGGLCGAGGGCDISRTSAASELPLGDLGPGLPIAILAMAFYAAFLVLVALRDRRPDDRGPRRILVGLALLATLYSVALFALSLVVQGSLCEFCSILYVVNLALLVVAWRDLDDTPGRWLSEVWAAIPSRATGLTTLAFVVVAVGVYLPYAGRVSAAEAQRGSLGEAVVDVDTDARPAKGPANAPIQIVEVADLQCPHCRVLFETLEEVQAARPDQIRLTYLHFPLDQACNPAVTREFHKLACVLSYISDCAGQQDRFFEVTGQLFKLGRGATREQALDVAAGLGLDMQRLRACVDSDATAARVRADIDQAAALGVKGTPVFFINGHSVTGARPRATIDAMIDDILAAPR